MASVLIDIATLANDQSFRLRIKAAMADKAQAILADVNATLEEVNWARRRINNLDDQVEVVAWYCAAVASVTAGTVDNTLKFHVSAAVAVLAGV